MFKLFRLFNCFHARINKLSIQFNSKSLFLCDYWAKSDVVFTEVQIITVYAINFAYIYFRDFADVFITINRHKFKWKYLRGSDSQNSRKLNPRENNSLYSSWSVIILIHVWISSQVWTLLMLKDFFLKRQMVDKRCLILNLYDFLTRIQAPCLSWRGFPGPCNGEEQPRLRVGL